MRVSVIIRSKDEADRLRLTLTSLAHQSMGAEIIVVNDGSEDDTAAVVTDAAAIMPADLPIVRVDHATPLGRSAAANAGARVATGDLLIFLDGDTLASPNFVAAHHAAHMSQSHVVARGETFHLRCTRFFADPESGRPKAGQEARVARMGDTELARMRVTRADIRDCFSSIDDRAQPGIYPGAGPRSLYDLEMDALRTHPECDVLWAAASGSNQSVARTAFLASGGFHPDLTINEHRELALRLCCAGLRMVATSARSYHLTHRSGWRDPLEDAVWEPIFYQSHPIPAVPLLSILWASLTERPSFPDATRITSLPALALAAQNCAGIHGIDAVREAHLMKRTQAQ